MSSLIRVPVPPLPPERFEQVLTEETYREFQEMTARGRDLLWEGWFGMSTRPREVEE